jgi:site-specific DNA recombinase
MSHSYCSKGVRRYRYYVCHRAQKRGWRNCPAPSVPAGEIERFVVEQIKSVGRDPLVIKDTLAEIRRQAEEQIDSLRAERKELLDQLRDDHATVAQLAATARATDPRLVEAHDRIRHAERRVTEIDDELAALDGELIDEDEVAEALADVDAMWECLSPREQSRVVELLIERVAYDGHASKIAITFRPAGIKLLAGELAKRKDDAA